MFLLTGATSQKARAATCHGASCTGLDPSGRCDSDAYTAATATVYDPTLGYMGQLDLRYSPSRASNWGRYSAAFGWQELVRTGVLSGYFSDDGIVSVWNPGEQSQGMVWGQGGSVLGLFRQTRWSKMVDGTKRACTGVRAHYKEPGADDHGDFSPWFWGPCR